MLNNSTIIAVLLFLDFTMRRKKERGLSRDCFGLVNCTLLEGWFSLSKLSSLKLRRRCAADEFLNLLWLWAWWRFLFSILRTVTTNIMDFNFQSWRPMPPPPSSFSKKEMLMKHSTSIIVPANFYVCTAPLNIIFIFFFHKKRSLEILRTLMIVITIEELCVRKKHSDANETQDLHLRWWCATEIL